MKANADDMTVTIHFKENSIPGLRRGELTAEAKQQLADGLVAALPERLVGVRYSTSINESEAYMDGYNEALDEVEELVYAYFGIGRNQDMGSSQDNTTPKVLGHEADNFNDRSAR